MSNTDTGIARYEAAIRAGLTGDEAKKFAAILIGDTPQEVEEYADRLVDFINEMTADPEDRPVRAYDHSQGRGSTHDTTNNALEDFRIKMRDVFRR